MRRAHYFKTGERLFQATHIILADFIDQNFKKSRNCFIRIDICQFKTGGRQFTTSGCLFKQTEACFKQVIACFCFVKYLKETILFKSTTVVIYLPSCPLFIQSQQKKNHNNMGNLFKVNDKFLFIIYLSIYLTLAK